MQRSEDNFDNPTEGPPQALIGHEHSYCFGSPKTLNAKLLKAIQKIKELKKKSKQYRQKNKRKKKKKYSNLQSIIQSLKGIQQHLLTRHILELDSKFKARLSTQVLELYGGSAFKELEAHVQPGIIQQPYFHSHQVHCRQLHQYQAPLLCKGNIICIAL